VFRDPCPHKKLSWYNLHVGKTKHHKWGAETPLFIVRYCEGCSKVYDTVTNDAMTLDAFLEDLSKVEGGEEDKGAATDQFKRLNCQ
jgi:hypothetical protein